MGSWRDGPMQLGRVQGEPTEKKAQSGGKPRQACKGGRGMVPRGRGASREHLLRDRGGCDLRRHQGRHRISKLSVRRNTSVASWRWWHKGRPLKERHRQHRSVETQESQRCQHDGQTTDEKRGLCPGCLATERLRKKGQVICIKARPYQVRMHLAAFSECANYTRLFSDKNS